MQQAVMALYLALVTQTIAIVIRHRRLNITAKNLQLLAEFHKVMSEATMDHIFQLRAKHKGMEVPDEYKVSK